MSSSCEGPEGIFSKQRRIIAVGDIHGDFLALYYCLHDCAEVINAKWEWRGRDTYVVIVGDMVDRYRPGLTAQDDKGWGIGEIPEEEFIILRALSKLDKAARKFGGRVLRLLGNHELLNLYYNQLKYVSPHARESKRREKLLRAFQRCGVYGMARIGSWVFIHGGLQERALSYNTENVYDRIQTATHKVLRENANKNQRVDRDVAFMMNLLEDRSFSQIDMKTDCDALDRVLQMVNDTGKTALHMVVAHSVQTERKQALLPSKITKGELHTRYDGPLVISREMPFGINSDCNGRLWRLDVAMSRSFDNQEEFDQWRNRGLLGKLLEARRPQVLEILNDEQAAILVSNRDLPRPGLRVS